MKATLIKTNNHYYLEQIPSKGISGAVLEMMMGSTDGEGYYKLSKQNCDEIFGVVDVKKLSKSTYPGKINGQRRDAFISGFNKAMELNKDKQFTLEDVLNAYMEGTNDGTQFESLMDYDSEDFDEAHEFAKQAEREFIKSLQQPTEIEVEIEMEVVPDFYPRSDEDGSIFTSNKKEQSKLDSDGCLILKKINQL
jgi:hypothetical protein